MRNLTLLTDFYELTMMYGYFKSGKMNDIAVFDVFFRQTGSISYSIFCGLEQVVEYIENIKFEKDDIEFLRKQGVFDEDFLHCLENFKFTGDIFAVREGTVVFPQEPLLIVRAPIFQAQLLETAILNLINHQTLIATKASKVCYEAGNASVLEFGLRRAQGPDAGIYGARAAIVGGCVSTSNVLAGKNFDVPVGGTHAHSWVMSFESELKAFETYAELYPDNCLLLVDTYDTLKSGVPNAIKVFKKLREKGHKPVGIRIDSGDLAYLTVKARKMLDEAGFKDAKIFASGDIDERIIDTLKDQKACIDSWGIGTKLITSFDNPSLGGVYKLAGIYEKGKLIPKLKKSDTAAKITNPGLKKIYRIYDKNTDMAIADLITLFDEKIDESKTLTIFHPEETWKQITIDNFYAKELMVQVYKKGKLVYNLPSLKEIVAFSKADKETFWDEYKRRVNPQIYKVDLSKKLFNLKSSLLKK